jgi:hypothetical protein
MIVAKGLVNPFWGGRVERRGRMAVEIRIVLSLALVVLLTAAAAAPLPGPAPVRMADAQLCLDDMEIEPGYDDYDTIPVAQQLDEGCQAPQGVVWV